MTSVSTDRRQGVNSSAAIKVPCRAATTAAITLSGEQTIDGVACVTGDRVLVKDQTDTTTNAIYNVDTGTWTRALDFNGAYDVKNGTLCYVNTGGAMNGGGWFIVSCVDPVIIGTTAITFSRQNINNVTLTSVVGTSGQTLLNVSTYQPGANAAAVFLNGRRLRPVSDYTETSATTITLVSPASLGDEYDIYTGLSVGQLIAALASGVAITDAGDYYVATTVEAVLQEIASAITADVGDASAVLTYNSSTRIQRWNSPLTANRTATLSTTDAREGASFVIVRGAGATGNYTLAVGALTTLYAPGEWCEVRYDAGTGAWILEKWGRLPSAGIDTLTADVGNASVTLAVGTSPQLQRWATTLTAERTATLDTTGAWAGAKFRIVRAESATGNFSLTVLVGTAVLCRLAPGQSCSALYTGTTWAIEAFDEVRQGLTSVNQLYDDFAGNEIDGARWQSLQGTSSACEQPIVYQGIGGFVRMTTGSDAGATMALNGVQLQSNLNWAAAKGGLSVEIRLRVDDITNLCLFLGLTDQLDVLEMPFTLGAGNALTSNATDAVGVLYDTAADTDDWWLVGVAADIDAAKQDSGLAPVNATLETWRIDIDAVGQAYFYRNGTLIGTVMTGAVTPAVALTPYIGAFSRAASSRNVDTDEILLLQQR